jgi:mannose-6-phosphate isomerase-like protein (cupin superfamily)
MIRFTTTNAAEALSKIPDAFIKLFEHGTLKIEWCKPEQVDKQMPHLQDEVYVISSGSGTFYNDGERTPVQTGDLLFVPAGKEHRFENFTPDFATWVLFYGPEGGE